MRTRMVPFQRQVQRLTRIARQAAAETGKKVEVRINGAAGELDRQVLERMLAPFRAHAAERHRPRHRIARGAHRRRQGRDRLIDVTLKREGSEVVIAVADDGAGVNLKLVRDRAVALGLTTPKQELSDEQALQLILEPGFSTAGKVTQSAGRGVGMDVVATEIKKLGGSLYTETWPGKGTPSRCACRSRSPSARRWSRASGEELYRAAAADGRGRRARAALGSAAAPRRGVRELRLRRAEVSLPAPRIFRQRHAVVDPGARRGRARDPGARGRAFDGDRDRRADRQPRDRGKDRGTADLRDPRHLRRDDPGRWADLHHPRRRRARALRVAPASGPGARGSRRRSTGASSRLSWTTRSPCGA